MNPPNHHTPIPPYPTTYLQVDYVRTKYVHTVPTHTSTYEYIITSHIHTGPPVPTHVPTHTQRPGLEFPPSPPESTSNWPRQAHWRHAAVHVTLWLDPPCLSLFPTPTSLPLHHSTTLPLASRCDRHVWIWCGRSLRDSHGAVDLPSHG